MAKLKIDETEKKLKDLAITRNIELGEMDLKDMDRDEFTKELLRARQLGMFLRDRELSRRIESGQQIRIINLISTDTEQRKQYIEMTMPQVMKPITKA